MRIVVLTVIFVLIAVLPPCQAQLPPMFPVRPHVRMTPRMSCGRRHHSGQGADRLLHSPVEPKPLRGGSSSRDVFFYRWALVGYSFLQVASRDKEEGMQQADSEKLLAETLAAHGRSPRTQETYVLMLHLFGRYLEEKGVSKAIDGVAPEDIEAYQRYPVCERKVGFSSFNQSTCALRFFYRECLGRTDWTVARRPYQRKRRVLPEILSREVPSDIDPTRMSAMPSRPTRSKAGTSS
jgi:Phage integrase, N-terminal SAM-like domain